MFSMETERTNTLTFYGLRKIGTALDALAWEHQVGVNLRFPINAFHVEHTALCLCITLSTNNNQAGGGVPQRVSWYLLKTYTVATIKSADRRIVRVF